MSKSLKTSNHLSTCASNFLRIKKILRSFKNDHYSFDLLYSGKINIVEGIFSYNNNEFSQATGKLILDPSKSTPYAEINAETQLIDENIENLWKSWNFVKKTWKTQISLEFMGAV